MPVSRRRFVKIGASAALFAAAPLKSFAHAAAQESRPGARTIPAPAPAAGGEGGSDSTFYLKKSSFTPYVGTGFTVRGEVSQGAASLTLVEVRDLRRGRRQGPAEPDEGKYALLFAGSRRAPLAQDVYHFEHDALGEFWLMLVPTVHKDTRRRYYEAVVNQL